MRLVDADALKAEFDKNCAMECACCDHATCNHVRNAVGCGLVDAAPTIYAIPVEWLEAQIRPYTGDVSDIGKTAKNGTIKGIIRKWQKEQEAR